MNGSVLTIREKEFLFISPETEHCIVSPPKENGAYIYLHQVIRGMKFKKNGSVQQQLTVPEISFIEIPYPHSSVLHEYNNVASPIVEMIERNINENEILTKQRDELLPLLMNGQAMVNYHLSDD